MDKGAFIKEKDGRYSSIRIDFYNGGANRNQVFFDYSILPLHEHIGFVKHEIGRPFLDVIEMVRESEDSSKWKRIRIIKNGLNILHLDCDDDCL